MDNKLFWTLDRNGSQVIRDLKKESGSFTLEKYNLGEFDANNYMWYEHFDFFVYDSRGCDYDRYGCTINEGDVVLDFGGNIGIFAHWAESKGASRVISFEPLTPTFDCLYKNKGPKTEVYKLAVWSETTFKDFVIHTDFSHIGGGSFSESDLIDNRPLVHSEKVFCLDVADLFSSNLFDHIDFFKIDIEGAEVEVLNNISDEHLQKMRCITAEFHSTGDEFESFQNYFLRRCERLGFRHFTLYQGDGKLRTVNIWKD